ncbi:MAG: ABC transporter permease [Desulfobacterales bacterium]|nr:ABC transporter permease [Desulfobacterales bacterium]
MAIGVAAVVVLTSLGEGARRYVTGEFQALGTDLLIVLPGRSETTGVQPGAVRRRDAARPDARRRAGAAAHAGRASASRRWWSARRRCQRGELAREVPVLGSTAEFLDVRNLSMGQGRFLPPGELDRDMRRCA